MGAIPEVQVLPRADPVSEVKRNCMRVTECGKEAWSINCEPMDKNRIEGAAKQGEQAMFRARAYNPPHVPMGGDPLSNHFTFQRLHRKT